MFWDCVHQHALLAELVRRTVGHRELALQEPALAPAADVKLFIPPEESIAPRPPFAPRRALSVRRAAGWASRPRRALLAFGVTWLASP